MVLCILIGVFGLILETIGGILVGKNPGDMFGKWK
jgi:hypothetical protein